MATLDDALVLEDVENRQGSGECDRIPNERPADRSGVGVVHDRRATDHTRKRKAAGDRLGDDQQVGLDVEVLHREHAARPAESRLHLVGDEDDPVLVTEASQPADELGRRRNEATFALLRLEHDRGDVIGRNVGREHPLERGERRLGIGAAVGVRIRRPVDLRRERAEALLVRVRPRGHGQCEQRAAVKRAVERDHAVPSRVQPGDLHRVLDRLGAGAEERTTSRRR